MKKSFAIVLMTLFFFSIATEADAQRRSKKSRSSDRSERTRSSRDRGDSDRTRDRDRETETIGLKDRLYYEIPIGNLNLNGGFSISGKPSVGYKATERLSAGVGVRTFYYFINNPAGFDDQSFLFYGPAVFGRVKVTQDIYIQAEYDYNSYQFSQNADRRWIGTPLLGLGYSSGYGPWKYGLQLLFIMNDEIRNIEGSVVDYWININYNF